MSARADCRACGWTRTYASPARAAALAARHVCRRSGAPRATRRHRCARCGLEVTYENATASEARNWFSRHSCRKQEDAMVRSAYAAAREALIDRTPQPCLHKQANHQHGTNAAYVLDKCRCQPCVDAKTAHVRNWIRQKAYGRYQRYVDARGPREHVRALMDAGVGLKRIQKISGVSQGALWKLVYGKRRPDGSQIPSIRVTRETAEKLYAIDPEWSGDALPLADGALDPAGTRLARTHLRALVALGWSMSELGRRLGIKHVRNACVLINDDARTMQRRTVIATEALFRELCMTPPPQTNQRQRISASRARNLARQRGWAPPLALEDLDVDQEAS